MSQSCLCTHAAEIEVHSSFIGVAAYLKLISKDVRKCTYFASLPLPLSWSNS